MSGSHDHAGGGPAGDLASPVHRLDPRAKILGLLAVTLVGGLDARSPRGRSGWRARLVLAAVAAVGPRARPRDLGARRGWCCRW